MDEQTVSHSTWNHPLKCCRVGGGSAMMTELDGTASRPRHGGGGEDPGHGEDAAGLGRGQHHRPGPGAGARRRGRGGGVRAWPDARAGILGHGEPGGHPRGGAGAEDHARHRQRRCHHAVGRASDDRANRLCRREHWPRRLLQSLDLPANAALPEDRRAAARTLLRRARAGDVPPPRLDDRGVRRSPRLPDVSQGRPVVCQAVRSGQRVQQARGARLQPRRVLEILEYYRRWREQFLDAAGELKPRFPPPPLVASFMQPLSPPAENRVRPPGAQGAGGTLVGRAGSLRDHSRA